MKRKSLDIAGKAVVEGVMIKNQGQYAMALRKGNSDIEIIHDVYKGIMGRGSFSKIPFLRGIFALIDEFILTIKLFLFSSDYHEDNGEEEPRAIQKIMKKVTGKYHENVEMAVSVTVSLIAAVLCFIILPYYISGKLGDKMMTNNSKMMLVEAIFRVIMLLIYIGIFCLNKDIRRILCYHGAQHKVLNCLRKGNELTIKNVRRSQKYDKECNVNFVFYVIFISVVLFSFVRNDDVWLRMGMRVLIIPLVAAVLYEVMLLVNKMDNAIGDFLQFPQKLIQKIFVVEPTDDMMEVAIESVTAVFDWREYLGLEPEEIREEDYSMYNYQDNVTSRGDYNEPSSNSQMLYDENLSQNYNLNNQNLGYTNVNTDYYNNETYNYEVPSYDQSQYDYSGQYFIDSEGKENSAYKDVVNNEVTKRNEQEYTSNYSDVSYEDLYNSYTQGQELDTYSMQNNYNNQNYDYNATNYSSNNYNSNDYSQNYNYNNQNGQMQNKNYYEDNEDLSSLDRYFDDDNY